MFDRLQKPFLTVETGEAYQPVRLTYLLTPSKKSEFIQVLESLESIQKNTAPNSWTWYWKGDSKEKGGCKEQPFASVDSFRANPQHPTRLGTITLREDKLYLNLASFKRACMATPFFYRLFDKHHITLDHADFINKVFAVDERLPHGFTELFKDEELNAVLHQRLDDYQKIKQQCEHATTAEEAFSILSKYTQEETHKRLPYAERYEFSTLNTEDPDVVFLGFYIFLRGRELVAIKRWYGQTNYTLSDASDQFIEQVFGGLGIDLID